MILLVAAALAIPAPAFPSFPSSCARADFPSRGRVVRAELCRPEAAATGTRTVVVLHGCGGFSTFDHRLTAELPRYGVATLDVDYFGLTGPPGSRGFCGAHQAVATAFPTWLQIVLDAARSLRASATSIGVVGWSLGAGVALGALESGGRQVFRAAALFSVGYFGRPPPGLPPTLLLSGGSRDAVPVADTLQLYRAIRAAGGRAAVYVYGDGTHDWPGPQGTAGIARAARFLLAEL